MFSFFSFLQLFIHQDAFSSNLGTKKKKNPKNLGTKQEIHYKWGPKRELGRSLSLYENAKGIKGNTEVKGLRARLYF